MTVTCCSCCTEVCAVVAAIAGSLIGACCDAAITSEANDALLAEELLPCAVLVMKEMSDRGFRLSTLRDVLPF